jgi:hypothetical protein
MTQIGYDLITKYAQAIDKPGTSTGALYCAMLKLK